MEIRFSAVNFPSYKMTAEFIDTENTHDYAVSSDYRVTVITNLKVPD